MIERRLADISVDDIRALVTNSVRESRTIEFKRGPIGGSEKDKHEFRADVSSLANAAGGDLIIGVDARDGAASEAWGFEVANMDTEKLRLAQLLRDGLDPRLPSVEFHEVQADEGRWFLVIRVAQSWIGPHRVHQNHAGPFYTRTSAGAKHSMDVVELRQAFLSIEGISERIRRFSADRLAAIMRGETPITLPGRGTLVMHFVPQASFSSQIDIDMSKDHNSLYQLMPWRGGGSSLRRNLDGWLVHSGGREASESDRYIQCYRSGPLECVFDMSHDVGDGEGIPSLTLDETIVDMINNVVTFYKTLEIQTNVYCFPALINVGRYMLFTRDFRLYAHPRTDRENLVLPDFMIDSSVDGWQATARDIADRFWTAWGHDRSFNFAEDGRFQPAR